jgi:hypothetical protein
MAFLLIFLIELLLLFFSSTLLVPTITRTIHGITKSRRISIHLLFYILLPGIIIHELSHVLFSGLLFVPIGKMHLYPELTESRLHLGSVEVGKTGFIRRFIIGISPIIFGLILILLIIYSLINKTYFLPNLIPPLVFDIVLMYFLFTIVNTMFSSRKDMEGAWKFFLAVFLIGIIFYFIGFRITYDSLNFSKDFLQKGSIYLLIPLVLNFAAYFFLKLVFKKR